MPGETDRQGEAGLMQMAGCRSSFSGGHEFSNRVF
jgi:hypothetical protein